MNVNYIRNSSVNTSAVWMFYSYVHIFIYNYVLLHLETGFQLSSQMDFVSHSCWAASFLATVSVLEERFQAHIDFSRRFNLIHVFILSIFYFT